MSSDTTGTASGFGRVLVAVYAVFAFSATGRTVYQLATKASEAPLAFSLSAVAALVYVVATYALARRRRTLATWAIWFELVGVVVVGALSFAVPEWFPEATVWSHFGSGYGYIPLVLPFVGLWWLRRHQSS